MSNQTYYVKCATQAERDSLLDYAVKRGATQTGTRQPFDMEVFAMLYNTSKKWVVMSYHEVYPHEIQLTHDSFRRKVRKLWPSPVKDATPKPKKAPKVRKPSQLDRIEAKLDTILSGATFMQELEKAAPRPEGLKPGDYTDASKEVADALTAMGFKWIDYDRAHGPLIYWGYNSTVGFMVNDNCLNYDRKTKLTPAEFLSRAAVTAKEIGLVPVVENWVPKVGDWVVCIDPVGKALLINGYIGQVEKTWSSYVDFNDLPKGGWDRNRFRPATDAEIQQHLAEKEARANAEKLAKLKFGTKVEWKMGGVGLADFRVVCESLSKGGKVKILDANSYAADPFWVLLSDITVID